MRADRFGGRSAFTFSRLLIGGLVVSLLIAGVVFLRSTPKTIETNSALLKEEIKEDFFYYLPLDIDVSPETFIDRSNKLHLIRKQLSIESPESYSELDSRCRKLSQHLQLLDTECSALWLHKLRHNKIIGVQRFWGFEDTHFGAITVILEGGLKAQFKPCTSTSEDTTKEIIASYLDQLLGFGQTAPVITRRIPVADIQKFVEPSSFDAFEDTAPCAIDGIFEGPMIGWWEDLIPVRTVRKYKEEIAVSIASRQALAQNLYTTQMQSRYHAFYWLINILRHGKDEFVTKYGDLVSLDLDRSRFVKTSPPTSPSINYTWCYSCYMDQYAYDVFQAVGPKQPLENRLGHLMRNMLSHEDIFSDLWSVKLYINLDERVSMLLGCIDDCIAKYGRDNVILNEKRTMTSRELVEYYVSHSAYKNQNGQKGPSNFDFLDQL